MAAISVTLNGVICDLYGRTITGPVKIVGELMYSDRGVGGGPMPPGEGGGDGGLGIWGGANEPFPTPPIANVPGAPGYRPPGTGIWPNPPEGSAPIPSHPIALPGDPWWPPDAPKPPELPPPGSPPVLLPGSTPVHPIAAPAAIVVDYPGMGKVLVPQPVA